MPKTATSLPTKMVEMNGQMVPVTVCPPSRRRAASSVQRKTPGKQKPIRQDKRPGKDALSFALPLVAQVQRHLSLIPIKRDELARRSILDSKTLSAVLNYMFETGLAIEDNDGIISGTIEIR